MAASEYLHPQLFDPGPTPSPAGAAYVNESLRRRAESGARNSPAPRNPIGAEGKRPKWAARQGTPDHLKMFMSSNEIQATYQPLDGDRQNTGWGGGWGGNGNSYQDPEWQSSGSYESRAGEPTGRSRTTGYDRGPNGRSNDPRGQEQAAGYNEYNTTLTAGTRGGDPIHPFKRHAERSGEWHSGEWHSGSGGNSGAESSPDLWARKYEESKNRHIGGPLKYLDAGGKTTAGFEHLSTGGNWHENKDHPDNTRTLATSIVKEGVLSPVRLGETVGSEGKNEVVGGHHRLAVMQFNRPDDVMPVLHYRSLQNAKNWGSSTYNPAPISPVQKEHTAFLTKMRGATTPDGYKYS